MLNKAQLEAYKNQKESGKAEIDKAYILKFHQQENVIGTDLTQLMDVFQMGKSTIVARRSELIDEGKLYKGETRKVGGTSYTIYHYEPCVFKQMERSKDIRNGKYKKALRKLSFEFKDRIPETIKHLETIKQES